MLLKQLIYEQITPTYMYIDNSSALQMINDNSSPTDCTCHTDIQYFDI